MAAVLPAEELEQGAPPDALPSKSGAWLMAASWCYAALTLLWFTQDWGSARLRALVELWSPLPSALLALSLLLPLIRRMPAGSRRGGWTLLALAAFTDMVATVWWAVVYAPPAPLNSLWMDLPYFLYYPLGTAAFLMFFRDLGGSLRSRAVLLDAATLALGFGAALWLYLLRPQAAQLGWPSSTLISLAAFCAGNGVLMVVVSLMIARVLDWRADGSLLLAAAASFCAFTTDLSWPLTGNGYYDFQLWSSVGGYGVYYALLGTGVFLERHWRIPANARVVGGNRYSVLPILSVLVAVVMLFGEGVHSSGPEWLVLVGFALAGVLLVVARQRGIAHEIDRLGMALARRDAQAHLTGLIRHSADMIAVVDAGGDAEFVSPASQQVLGVPAADLLARPVASMLGAEHEERMRGFLHDLGSAPRRRCDIELIVNGADGRRRALQIVGVNQLENPVIAGLTLTFRDVTARRRLERTVLEIAVLERQRLAGDIRGALGAELQDIKRRIAALRESAARREACGPALGAAVTQVNHSIDIARRLSITLAPLHVARGALDVALRSLCNDYSQRFATRIEFRCRLGACEVSSRQSDHLYQIAQEILDHAVAIAAGGHIEVGLYGGTSRMHLHVLEAAPPGAPADSRHALGLRLAEYRAHVLGGTLQRHVSPQSTSTDVTVPLTL